MPTFTREQAAIAYDIEGDGPSLVAITGITDHRNSYGSKKLRKVFASRYTVLSLDNRGSGQTALESGASVTIDTMADDIAALIAHHNLGPAHVHGVSMGGLIAATLALRHPDKVRTLVSTVSSAGFDSRRARHLLTTWREMLDRDMPRDIINRFTASFLLGEEAFEYERYIDAWIEAEADPYEQTREGFDLQINAGVGYDLRDQLSAISAPTLVAGSPSDQLVPFRCQRDLAAGIPGAELKQYPGGHMFMTVPMFEKPYLQDVFAFWERHDGVQTTR